jgi:hypothetical protein
MLARNLVPDSQSWMSIPHDLSDLSMSETHPRSSIFQFCSSVAGRTWFSRKAAGKDARSLQTLQV